MIIIFRPEDGEEQRWDTAEVKATFAEAKAAEKAGGFKWSDLETELASGTVEVMQAALWVLRKRTEPTLTFADLEDLPLGAVDVQYGTQERKFMRTLLENDPKLSEEERTAALSLLADPDDGETAAGAEPGPKGKTKAKA